MKHQNEVSVSLIQGAPVVGNIPENMKKVQEYAATEKADLLVFPELYLTGYHCRDELHRLAIRMDGPEIRKLEEIAAAHGSHIIIGAPVLEGHEKLYNSSLLIGPDGYIGRYDKLHLAEFLPFEEKMFFHSGNDIPVFDTAIGKIGMLICFDLFFPELCMAYTAQGADILVCISASPSFSRYFFETVGPARAIENTAFFMYNNLTGTEERLTFWGGAYVMSPKGFQIAKGEYYKEQAVRATLDMRELAIARSGRPTLRDRRPDILDLIRSLE